MGSRARKMDEGNESSDELPSPKSQSSPKVPYSGLALRHAGEVITGLWVGDIRSVSYIDELVHIMFTRHNEQQSPYRKDRKINVTITIISVMSSVNLLQYVSDLLKEKQTQLKDTQYLQQERKLKQDGLENKNNLVASNISDQHEIKIRHIKVFLRDSVDSDLMTVLNETSASIDEALGVYSNLRDRVKTTANGHDCIEGATFSNDNVDHRLCLVHCAKGASRSVSVVIGYLLSRHPTEFPTFKIALEHIRKVRPNAMPNVRFAIDLRRYAKELNTK